MFRGQRGNNKRGQPGQAEQFHSLNPGPTRHPRRWLCRSSLVSPPNIDLVGEEAPTFTISSKASLRQRHSHRLRECLTASNEILVNVGAFSAESVCSSTSLAPSATSPPSRTRHHPSTCVSTAIRSVQVIPTVYYCKSERTARAARSNHPRNIY